MGEEKNGAVLVSIWSKRGFDICWLGSGASGVIARSDLGACHTRC